MEYSNEEKSRCQVEPSLTDFLKGVTYKNVYWKLFPRAEPRYKIIKKKHKKMLWQVRNTSGHKVIPLFCLVENMSHGLMAVALLWESGTVAIPRQVAVTQSIRKSVYLIK